MSQNSKDYSRRYGSPGALGKAVRNILIWSYDRGTLQYDVICALILAFIFFVPRSCFVSKAGSENAQEQSKLSSSSTNDVGTVSAPSQKKGH